MARRRTNSPTRLRGPMATPRMTTLVHRPHEAGVDGASYSMVQCGAARGTGPVAAVALAFVYFEVYICSSCMARHGGDPRRRDPRMQPQAVAGTASASRLSSAAVACPCPWSCPTRPRIRPRPLVCAAAKLRLVLPPSRGWRATASACTRVIRRARRPGSGWRARWRGGRRSCATCATLLSWPAGGTAPRPKHR